MYLSHGLGTVRSRVNRGGEGMEGELEFLRELPAVQEVGQSQGALTKSVLTSHPGNSPGSHQWLSSTSELSQFSPPTLEILQGPISSSLVHQSQACLPCSARGPWKAHWVQRPSHQECRTFRGPKPSQVNHYYIGASPPAQSQVEVTCHCLSSLGPWQCPICVALYLSSVKGRTQRPKASIAM